MGQPVVHFEIAGKDGKALQSYYLELFRWTINDDNPIGYGMVAREGNGIAGGISGGPEGYEGPVTVYIEVPVVEAWLAKAESLGGTRIMGPDRIMNLVVLGQFANPEGHMAGSSRPLS